MARKYKPRHGKARASQSRKAETRQLRKSFLIITEGTKTEPNYFEMLKQELSLNIDVKIIGLGKDPHTLLQKMRSQKAGYSKAWCVFDKDNIADAAFNAAIQSCQAATDEAVAWSNASFELWLVLHFDYHSSASQQAAYEKKLSKLLPTFYQKNMTFREACWLEQLPTAINNAKHLHKAHQGRSPAQANPCTTVYCLVEELQNYAASLQAARYQS